MELDSNFNSTFSGNENNVVFCGKIQGNFKTDLEVHQSVRGFRKMVRFHKSLIQDKVETSV